MEWNDRRRLRCQSSCEKRSKGKLQSWVDRNLYTCASLDSSFRIVESKMPKMEISKTFFPEIKLLTHHQNRSRTGTSWQFDYSMIFFFWKKEENKHLKQLIVCLEEAGCRWANRSLIVVDDWKKCLQFFFSECDELSFGPRKQSTDSYNSSITFNLLR